MTFSILTSEAFGVHFAFGLSLAAHTLCPPRTYTSSPSLSLSLSFHTRIPFTAALHFIVVLSCAWGIEMRMSFGAYGAADSSSNVAPKWHAPKPVHNLIFNSSPQAVAYISFNFNQRQLLL